MKLAKPFSIIAAAGIAAAAACSALAQQAAPAPAPTQGPVPVRIGFVNIERVMREALPAKRVEKGLESETQKRDQEMRALVAQMKRLQDALENSANPLPEDERRRKAKEFTDMNREFERKKEQYTEELMTRRAEAMGGVVELANRTIKQIAQQENLDAVFQEAAWSSPRIDLTDKVIKAMNAAPQPAAK